LETYRAASSQAGLFEQIVGLIVLNLDKWLRAVLFWLGTTGLDLLLGLLRARTKVTGREETLIGREIFSRHAWFTC
jgi:hypothetical protein